MNHSEPIVVEKVVGGEVFRLVIQPGALTRFAQASAGQRVYGTPPAPETQQSKIDESVKVPV